LGPSSSRENRVSMPNTWFHVSTSCTAGENVTRHSGASPEAPANGILSRSEIVATSVPYGKNARRRPAAVRIMSLLNLYRELHLVPIGTRFCRFAAAQG